MPRSQASGTRLSPSWIRPRGYLAEGLLGPHLLGGADLTGWLTAPPQAAQCAAVHASQRPFTIQALQVAADGHVCDIKQLTQLGGGDRISLRRHIDNRWSSFPFRRDSMTCLEMFERVRIVYPIRPNPSHCALVCSS